MNHLRRSSRPMHNIYKFFQEEAYRVTTTLTMTQGIIKQVVEEGVEKVQDRMTTENSRSNFAEGTGGQGKGHNNKVTFDTFMAH
jgi:hypothetical protein